MLIPDSSLAILIKLRQPKHERSHSLPRPPSKKQMGIRATICLLVLPILLHICSATQNTRMLTSESTPSSIINQYLSPHNKMRAKLGLPPLQWSEELARYARWWAHQRQGDCAMIHSQSDYGENLFWGSTGRSWGPKDAVAYWNSEKWYYNYRTNSCWMGRECLHYTQIIWRHTLRVGCARVICSNGYTFIGCNYDPHGNIMGQKPY